MENSKLSLSILILAFSDLSLRSCMNECTLHVLYTPHDIRLTLIRHFFPLLISFGFNGLDLGDRFYWTLHNIIISDISHSLVSLSLSLIWPKLADHFYMDTTICTHSIALLSYLTDSPT